MSKEQARGKVADHVEAVRDALNEAEQSLKLAQGELEGVEESLYWLDEERDLEE